MTFGVYSYTATILIFCGAALLAYCIKLLTKGASARLSPANWKAIGWTMLIMTALTGPMEFVALSWRTWTYNPARTFDTIFFGAEAETYLFVILVTLVVSIATLVYANQEDRTRAKSAQA